MKISTKRPKRIGQFIVVLIVLLCGLAVLSFRAFFYIKDMLGRSATRDIRIELEDELDFNIQDDILGGNIENYAGIDNRTDISINIDKGSQESKSNNGSTSNYSDDAVSFCKELIAKLREEYDNDEVIGYVVLDGYDVEYPIMYGETNDSYIKTNPYGNYDYNGSIFLDSENRPDFSDSRMVVYGHNMINNSMFGCLNDYYSDDIDDKTFTVYTENGIMVFNILSSEMINPFGDNYCLFPGQTYKKEYEKAGYSDKEISEILSTDTKMEEFYSEAKSNSFVWNDKVAYDENSKIMTLMTCYGDGTYRFGVSGVLIDENIS